MVIDDNSYSVPLKRNRIICSKVNVTNASLAFLGFDVGIDENSKGVQHSGPLDRKRIRLQVNVSMHHKAQGSYWLLIAQM